MPGKLIETAEILKVCGSVFVFTQKLCDYAHKSLVGHTNIGPEPLKF